jgi:glycopeptide antibiotics resistance protein
LPAWTILPIFLMSPITEAGQRWMPARYMSMDNLLLNTLGGAIGLLLARRLRGGLPRTRAGA